MRGPASRSRVACESWRVIPNLLNSTLLQATQQPAVSPLAEAQAAELKALLRVTITNTIFTTSLPAAPPPGKKVKISFSAHPHFPVFSLVDAKH